MAHTVVALGEIDQSGGGQIREDLFADLAVYYLVSLLGAVKQEGQIQNFRLIVKLRKTGGPCKDNVDGSHTRRLKGLGIVAQFSGMVGIQGDLAAGSFLNQLFVFQNRLGGHGILVARRIDGQCDRVQGVQTGDSCLGTGLTGALILGCGSCSRCGGSCSGCLRFP